MNGSNFVTAHDGFTLKDLVSCIPAGVLATLDVPAEVGHVAGRDVGKPA